MNIRKRIGIASILIGCCAAIGAVVVPGHVSADSQITLHNPGLDPSDEQNIGDDCPNTTGDYWHFILSPNQGRAFVSIHLVLNGVGFDFPGDGPIIPNNGPQWDNVFVELPDGFEFTDLDSGSATYTGDPVNNFNISHFCIGDGDDGTETTDPTETTDASTSTTDEGGEESGGPTTTDSESGGGIPGAGADNGTLAMLAAFLLIGGGTLVLTSRRRPTETLS